jgi:hypothetical protein
VKAIPRSRAGDYIAAVFRRRPYICRWCRRRFRARTRGVEVLAPPQTASMRSEERAAAGPDES